MVHRIVYYLRSGLCPDRYCVQHSFLNRIKDNRLDLKATHLPYPQKKLTSYV